MVTGLVHAGLEDRMFAPGYYLCVFYWRMAFIFVDRRRRQHSLMRGSPFFGGSISSGPRGARPIILVFAEIRVSNWSMDSARRELLDRHRNFPDGLGGEFGINGERKHLRGRLLCLRKISAPVAKIGIGGLQVLGQRIMEAGLNALRLEGCLQGVAVPTARRIGVIHVASPRHLLWRGNFGVSEKFVVLSRDGAPRVRPRL